MNIDFKKFHKIECDDKCTVLQHPSGHEIRISHKNLSPEHQEELEKLPLRMAKGGQPSKPSMPSKPMPQAAYKAPKQASKAFTEPDNGGTRPFDDVVISALHREMPPMGAMQAEKPHYPPCINPSCKSYGHSHPNCRCYGGNPEGQPSGEMQHRFAKGGDVESYCSTDRPHKKDCEYFKAGGMAEGETPQEPVQTEDPELNQAIDESQNLPETSPTAEQASKAINPNPEMGTDQGEAPAPETTPEQSAQEHGAKVAQHLMNEDAAVKSDINAGHIQPQTYKDLFEKKDTLGKIGTLFGMLVGGAGSGLTGQPNVIMQMMDNTIQNDLKAQQESAANKQNFLKINQSNLANNANINLTQEQAKQVGLANSYMIMNRAALDSLVKANSQLPEGSPQRQQGDQMIALLSQGIDKKNMSIAAQAGMAQALSHMAGGVSGQGNTTFMKSGMMGPEFKELGTDIEEKTIPGIPGRAARPIQQQDRDKVIAMKVLSDKAKDVLDFAQKHKGTINPAVRKQGEQKAAELVNFYNQSLGGALTGYKLPWLEGQIGKNPTSIFQDILGNNAKLNEIKNSNDTRMGTLLSSYGYAKPKMSQSEQMPQAETKTMNGAQYKRVNGGWQKVK